MEGRAFFEGNQNTFRNVLLVQNKKAGQFGASFCIFSQSGKQNGENKSLNSCEKQLRSLDSYFRKLQNGGRRPSLSKSSRRTELMILDEIDQFTAKKGLTYLDNYFGKLNEDGNTDIDMSYSPDDESYVVAPSPYLSKGYNIPELKEPHARMQLKDRNSRVAESRISEDETSNLYLIGILAAINIAVFLFEIASPVRNSELQLFSIPTLYGAKINQLILVGEWWRLLTPMFLHAGVFHIGLSCWMLVTFGPRACRVYGGFAFFLIYLLGGLSGNLISFLHTSDPTVCGTGPVFAIMGALFAYQIQNRGSFGDNESEKMLQKAIIATCLSCTLNNFGPVDDWTHLAAAFTGLAFGYFTCPMIQLDDKPSKNGQDDGIRLVTRYADSCKSVGYFCFFLLLWCSLLFAVEPPL
ncbi:OLC1v1010769C1 [Oldenlandia corymbosa var. corymbosa]|uniref:OLC1v1010769C1 n=1 Tax=Oldenlandia corymbosa var. corymbosa TaxID=529605 RepID=A0AAV1DUK4_OLDCO|nr:OLC1v1010769C1 [Oldenlandia corymbosa var. corymbosa]